MSIYQSINSFCFMFPVSFAVAGSARIGNLLGAGDPLGAKTAAQVSVLFAALASATCGCLLYFTPHTFLPSLFAPDEPDVILETSRTIPLLSTCKISCCGSQRWAMIFVADRKSLGMEPLEASTVPFSVVLTQIPIRFVIQTCLPTDYKQLSMELSRDVVANSSLCQSS